jgi:hypothetical protein
MTLAEDSEVDRRSSVRVKSLLPIKTTLLDEKQLEITVAKILDLAVMESGSLKKELPNWADRADEVPRDVLFILYELRAIRQQMTELQRTVLSAKDDGLTARWVAINDRGLFIYTDAAPKVKMGDLIEIKLQIPCVDTPEVLAVGEVVRLSTTKFGYAINFKNISDEHSSAIIGYALKRERELARSKRKSLI